MLDIEIILHVIHHHVHVHPRLNQELDCAKRGTNCLLDGIDLLPVRILIKSLESRIGTPPVDFSQGLLGFNCGP